jgi:hypothetical protein
MLKTIAIIYGIVFLIIGILGFLPTISPEQHLIGIFRINAAHNIVHLLTGIIAIGVGLKDARASSIFFRIFGVIYLIVAILGFYYVNEPIFGIIANNMADAWLHVLIAIVTLYLGFGVKVKAKK